MAAAKLSALLTEKGRPSFPSVLMVDSNNQQTMMQQLLRQAVAGDQTALDTLLRHSSERLMSLTRRMLGDFQRVRRWAETGDVLQNALVRLIEALKQVKPDTPRDFLALAALQIRRELIDLARRYYGPQGMGAHHDSRSAEKGQTGPAEQGDLSQDPSSLAQWSELHQSIDRLPQDEREIVDLLFYQGLSQAEAADLLNISVRTVQRRWHAALAKLHRVWNNQ